MVNGELRMKEKNKAKNKSRDNGSIFQKEQEIAAKSEKIQNKAEISKEELMKEYRFLSQVYKKLLKEMTKITRVGDVNYKKLMDANDQIQEQKSKLEVLNRELHEANAAKDKFYSIIAHDLRDPLQFFLFASDIMERECEDGKPGEELIREYVEKVFKTAVNMSALLENLLQWSGSQSGKIECRPRQFDLYILTKENTGYLIENARKKNIGLLLEIPEKTFVYADETMIKSVFRNLVGNAVKFTKPGGTVKIYITRDEKDDFIVTSVQDTGIGIPEDKLDKLFKIGENYITHGTAKERGTGLGLILCKEFVEKNNGEIRVKSQRGKGSLFEFSLPKFNMK